MNNLTIETEAEFGEAIDSYGELITEIEALNERAKLAKTRIELYATANGVKRHTTERFRLTMKKGAPALKRQFGVEEADAIALMKKSEVGRAYLVESYDSAALKRDFAGSSDGAELIESFGLMLTEPKPHAEVKAR